MISDEQRNDNPPKQGSKMPALPAKQPSDRLQELVPSQSAGLTSAQKRAGLGKRGEAVAAAWLQQHGYAVLARNWRCGRLELDLVARIGNTLVVVEVKTRRESGSDPPSRPEEAVSPSKQRKLGQAGAAFLTTQRDCLSLRFDVIAIRVRGDRCRLYHQQDAFFPGL